MWSRILRGSSWSWLPAHAARSTLEWPDDRRGDPATVEIARLGQYPLAIDITRIHLAGVDRDIIGDCGERRRRVVVGPGGARDSLVVDDQIVTTRRPLPLAER